MEDLDYTREVPGAADTILRTLEAFGFLWDGPVWRQRIRGEAYQTALDSLRGTGLTFPCACSRREIAALGRPGQEGPVYPGTCRDGIPVGREPRSMRIRVESKPIRFNDHVQGRIEQDLARDIGDFVLRRADGIHAYQLAVVVDDADQGVTHVVRGADLTLSTPRQLYLQRALELPTPEYAHLPLAVDRHGRKLSKSSASAPVDPASPLSALQRAWAFLGQPPLAEDLDCLGDFWAEAIAEWDRSRVPPLSRRSLVEPEIG